MNLLEILKFTEEYLKKYSFSKSRLEAEKLVSYVLNLDRIALYLHHERELDDEEKNMIKYYLKKMVSEEKKFDEVKEEKKDFKIENLEIFKKSIEYLEKFGVPNAKLDAEYIFSEVLSVNRNILKLSMAREISEENKNKIKNMLIARGKNREPLQYILGRWEFYGHPFKTDKRALIPRADTEILVEQCKILMYDRASCDILDIGTGSGAISISLAKELPNSQILGLDISQDAIDLANENKVLNGVENVNFILSDLFKSIEGKKFDLIVSNPPYISLEEYNTLMPEVKNYEPQNALTDQRDGLYFYEEITKQAAEFLKENAYLAFEIGYNQADKIKEIFKKYNFNLISLLKDYGGNNRVAIAMKKMKVDDEDVHLFE
ncbi:peptide chain release factor N(5)-glutamine methyltransferase [Fusobacterium russii]|uniref:peptide chain release factor N(5)-glutamine methyltransferase n=1 Tax=Fusobacterium russii TaxID=854 RepID=UPI0003A67EBC|nr:peptide chain release factor N(5)-glutamine methyltransferase [Fusobacterium russii]